MQCISFLQEIRRHEHTEPPFSEKLLEFLPDAFDTQGRVKVEPKEKMKARLGHSPDRADALALAVGTVAPEVRAWGSSGPAYGEAVAPETWAPGQEIPPWVWGAPPRKG